MFKALTYILILCSVIFEGNAQTTQLIDFKPLRADWLNERTEIKKEIDKIVRESKTRITESAKDLFNEFPKTGLLPFKFHIKEIKLFEHRSPDIVSVRLITYAYTGGAHGGKNYYSWNWSKTKKRFLSLDDLISPKKFELIRKEVREKLFNMQKQNDEYDQHRKDGIKRGTAKKEDFKIWNLKGNGYLFAFPEYQVGSYAAGGFEVFIK